MLRGENIIIFSCADWEAVPTSPQHLSINFAKENKVLFIDTFGSRWPSLRREHVKRIGHRLLHWFRGIRKQNIKYGQLYIYSPIALTLTINFKPFLFINELIFLNMLKYLIKKLDMKNPILIFYIPPPIRVIGKLQEKIVIYHCIDEWLTYHGGKNKIFMDSERKLIENADLVIAASQLLYEKKKQYARRISMIYHGVEYDHFTKEFTKETPLPEDIKNIPKPIIAAIGTVAYWMDFDLIKLIAQRHKEWSIVLIGPVESGVDIRSLTQMANIYFLRHKDYSELPNYYRAIDVFIVPFLLNEHIKYAAPTRFYEHLSSGKPIITTDFPAAHEIEKNLINIVSDKTDFVKSIEIALKEKDVILVERRKALAKKNTWNSKAEKISKIIEEIARKKDDI